jgi:hypothetical protein
MVFSIPAAPKLLNRIATAASAPTTMVTPKLKQFGDLEPGDLERHPVWIGCHTADYDKSWYEDTDEETFRPYSGKLPANPAEGMFLVRAIFKLRDGSRCPGFVTPAGEGWDKGNGGRPMFEHNHILGTQQPQMFVGDRLFGFWGGIVSIPSQAQQELYAALGKRPDAIFPVRFYTDAALTTGIGDGTIEGFYRRDHDGIHIAVAEPASGTEVIDKTSHGRTWFSVGVRGHSGYPQPEKNFQYLNLVYEGPCMRCGIFDRQIAPFRFKKSGRPSPSGFTQLNWVYDAFFVPPSLAQEILKAGITGVSFRPAVFHRGNVACPDRVQVVISTIIPCAETSRLPTVTCKPENEEMVALRAMFAKWDAVHKPSALSPEAEERVRKNKERIAAIPYCGRLKFHPPTALVLMRDNLKDTPDLFQTAEWFGSGGSAFRITLASDRFVNLVQERRWKGLVFHSAGCSGWSERATI